MEELMKVFKKIITILLSVFFITNATAMHHNILRSGFSEQEKYKQFLKQSTSIMGQVALGLGISYLSAFANTACHEFGHVAVAKIFCNGTAKIFFGVDASEFTPDDYLKPTGIYFKSFNPFIGAYSVTSTNPITTWQAVLIHLAGPLSGIATTYLQNYILNKQKVLPSLTKRLCIFNNHSNVLSQFGNLIPATKGTDGGQIANALNWVDFDVNGIAKNPLFIQWGVLCTSPLYSKFLTLAGYAYWKFHNALAD